MTMCVEIYKQINTFNNYNPLYIFHSLFGIHKSSAIWLNMFRPQEHLSGS